MALLQEACDCGASATGRKRCGSGGLGIPLLGMRESNDEHERGKNRAKPPPHNHLRPARIAVDYTFTLDRGDVLRGSRRGIFPTNISRMPTPRITQIGERATGPFRLAPKPLY